MSIEAQVAKFSEVLSALRTEVRRHIIGQEDVVDAVLVALFSNGHILLEGMPGLGKTLLLKTLASALQMDFNRIQFTPDLMPADVTGTNVLRDGKFEFRKGPVFTNILLADEINRATPKTQSSLLEAMQERTVTAGGQRFSLEPPFLVMATQNPIEQEGTYPLPEAQLDRFMLKVDVPLPPQDDWKKILELTTGGAQDSVKGVATRDEILALQAVVREVPISNGVMEHAIRLVRGTHREDAHACSDVKSYVRYGSSPRGAQSLLLGGKVQALMDGRLNVSKEDLHKSYLSTLRHRILLNFEADAEGITPDMILSKQLQSVIEADRDPIRA